MNHFKIYSTIIIFFFGINTILAAPKPNIRLSHNTVSPGDTIKVIIETSVPFEKHNIRLSKTKFRLFQHPNAPKKGVYRYVGHIGISRKFPKKQFRLHMWFSYADGRTYQTQYKIWVKKNTFKQSKVTLSPKKNKLSKDYESLRKENQTLGKGYRTRSTNKYFTHPFIMPVKNARLTSGFGNMRVYNNRPAWYHSGVDLGKHKGADIIASNHGKVIFTGPMTVHGNTILINHGWGIISIYNHLDTMSTQTGKWVKKGEKIGEKGEKGEKS